MLIIPPLNSNIKAPPTSVILEFVPLVELAVAIRGDFDGRWRIMVIIAKLLSLRPYDKHLAGTQGMIGFFERCKERKCSAILDFYATLTTSCMLEGIDKKRQIRISLN